MWAWWLLCQPSPKVRSATQKLLRESSAVSKRREPHRWVAEFTSQVECNPKVTRRKTAHKVTCQPNTARISKPDTVRGTQCHLLIQTWKRSFTSSRAYGASSSVDRCSTLPLVIQPMCDHHLPSRGECGSPGLSVWR